MANGLMGAGIVGYLVTRKFYFTLLSAICYGLGFGAQFALLLAILADLVNSRIEEETRPTEVSDHLTDQAEATSLVSIQSSNLFTPPKDNKKAKGNARDTGLWQMALLSPKIFAPAGGGALLDILQKYGKSHNMPHLGYIALYSAGAFFAILSGLLIWCLKNHFHKEVEMPVIEEERDFGEEEESLLVN